MSDQTLLPGITAERVPTSRLTMAVLSANGRAGHPVLFVHGNVSSSLFWQPTMLALPGPYRPATTPTTSPPSSRRSGWLRCTWWAGAWAAAWCCNIWPRDPVSTAPR